MNSNESEIVVYDLDKLENIESAGKLFFAYDSYGNSNILETILGSKIKENYNKLELQKTQEENKKLVEKLSKMTGISQEKIEMINSADELLGANINFLENFGCTSIGRNGVIGQTMDLFTVNLGIVREGNALYVTMPPYLTLMGMNKNIAFCTNYIPSKVKKGGVPISHLRRNILRQNSLEQALNHIKGIKVSTQANFLLTDGEKIIDIEVSPDEIKAYESVNNTYFAHTNHCLTTDIRQDYSCQRLLRAVELLEQNKDLELILDDEQITIPIMRVSNEFIGFGSIIKVIMDVKKGELKYKEPGQNEYVSLNV